MPIYCFKCGNEVQPICGRCLCAEAFQVILRQIEVSQMLNKQITELKAGRLS